ncbi:hypothetical protein KIL84_011766, partial [Mauremys mutica]
PGSEERPTLSPGSKPGPAERSQPARIPPPPAASAVQTTSPTIQRARYPP